MAALRCTCYGRGQACNKGERVGGGDWDYYVGKGMASRVVDYLVGKPEAGEDREDAPLSSRHPLRVVSLGVSRTSGSCFPASLNCTNLEYGRGIRVADAR